jgi:hypothetical protein
MRRFPFRLLFVCIFLPPVCYILTLEIVESYLQQSELTRLNQLIIRNHEALYEGRYTVRDEISRNIGQYQGRSFKYRLGVSTSIMVKTKDDRVLYPTQFRRELRDSIPEGDFSALSPDSLNFVKVAEENYRILNEGLGVSVEVKVRHNSWLSNGILVSYVFVSVFIFQGVVRRQIRESERREEEQETLIGNLSGQLVRAESRLKEVAAKEEDYLQRIGDFKKEKTDLSKDIDGLLEEMEKLESGLREQRERKEEVEYEVHQLREELDRLRERLPKPKKRKKEFDAVSKRFRVLYKNLSFTDRAIEGLLYLTDEFQLKAEEVIHKLNEDGSRVSVKRKVFGKGGKMNILEVDFSYSGRIYFQKDSQPGTKILAIGTKNTQEKDLTFIRG